MTPGHERVAAARNAAAPTRSSMFVVMWPSMKASLPSSAWWIDTFVVSPSISSSSSATWLRAMAASRSAPHTMSLPRSES
jgi:hypothetical protein